MAGRRRKTRAVELNSDGTLPSDVVDRIVAIREEIREEEGYGGQCGFVVDVLINEFGWRGISGVYTAPNGEPIGDHVWNVLADGTVVDGTADQYCEGHDGVRVVRPSDPEHARYRWEWTEDFNPGLADEYPELADVEWTGEFDAERSQRIRAERGIGWWLPDPSRYREWEPSQAVTFGR